MRDRLPIILSTTALLVALLGVTPLGKAAYNAVVPQNSVGAAQLKKGAVGTVKIRNNAVTSAKVKNGSLRAVDFASGQVPSASGGAVGAKGEKGEKGDTGSAAVLGCPAGTTRFVSVCIEKSSRGPATRGAAETDCADEQRRLPSVGELSAFRRLPGVALGTGEWTDEIADANARPTLVYLVVRQSGFAVIEANLPVRYRCVAGLDSAVVRPPVTAPGSGAGAVGGG